MDHSKILGVVLAGGKSQRFGEDKSQVKLADKLLIDYILSEINDEFKELAQNIALHITALIAEDASIQDILDSNYIKDPNLTIAELLKGKIGILGENIKITDFKKVSL